MDHPQSTVNCRKMFVGGLSPDMTSFDLRQYFSQFGSLEEVRVVGESRGKQRGYGFVTFCSREVMLSVLKNDGHRINGRLIDCNYAADPSGEVGDAHDPEDLYKKVFVADLPCTVFKEDVKHHCSQFGPVKKVLFFIRKNKEKAFAFVIFEK